MGKPEQRKRKNIAAAKLAKKRELAGVDTCKDCKKSFNVLDLYYGPDPYVEELTDKRISTVLCKKCYKESCDDI